MATTLQITNSDVFSLGYDWFDGADTEFLGMYGDNGGDPDGNAWLPMNDVDPASDEARFLISRGDAIATEVMYANNAGIANFLGRILGDEWYDDDNVLDDVRAAVGDKTYGWAHYGAYGTSDSIWVIQPVHP